MDNVTVVNQDNQANVVNDVNSKANTGKNNTSKNAGGNTSVSTGNASTNTHVTNHLNSNEAQVGGQGNGGGVNAEISGNTNDDNYLHLELEAATLLAQRNSAYVSNEVESKSNSGYNKADKNAGGYVDIMTGDVSNDTHIANALNSNSARISGGEHDGGVSAKIAGNANYGDNKMYLDLDAETLLAQNNNANVVNDVDSFGNSGKNRANKNAGGSVMIDTGNVDVNVHLDTMANFNIADVECDCLFDSVWAKIAGNTNNDNKIAADLEDALYVEQDNASYNVANEVEAYGKSGENKADRNAGNEYDDPSITTGNADINVDAHNAGNANVYGDTAGMDFPFPTMGGEGVNVNISFDLGDLLDWFLS
jgi:hypothetical protein